MLILKQHALLNQGLTIVMDQHALLKQREARAPSWQNSRSLLCLLLARGQRRASEGA